MGPFYAYKETRLNLDPATQGSTVTISLPTSGASTWPSRKTQKRPHDAEIPIAEDENAFRKKYLATAASIYHRQYHATPRSFLWRILDDGKILAIRAVDVCRQTNVADATLTLRLSFPSPITPGCVAFADSKEHDLLNVFAVTESRQLYTLGLRPDYFRKTSSTDDNVRDWCKVSIPSSFTIGHPHRLVALSADELLVSSPNGELQKLVRRPADGSIWDVTHYNDRSFRQNIRSWIPLQGGNSIRYEKGTIDLSTATSIASPSMVINDMPYAFTVSIDHQLRVWNLQTRKIAYMGDILNHEQGASETKPIIDPSYSQLIRVYDDNGSALCVTYSPLGNGEFKFWNVQPVEDADLEVTDLFPDNILEPQAPTTDLWTLADFSVVLSRTNIDSFTIWTLWKNNTTYRVQKLDFQSASHSRVRDAWASGWVAMAAETLRETPLPTILHGDPTDGTDKWLEYILAPGRFARATIETGLAIYDGGLGAKDLSRRSGSLAERMCSSIASTAALGRTSDKTMDFEQFRVATDMQWRRFYRLLIELDKQRGEALSLVMDPQGAMPWVILADGITAVRDCSYLEQIWHNPEVSQSETQHVAALVTAAAALRDSLSDQFHCSCSAAFLGELFEEPSLTDPARMRSLYDKCDFANQIGDEEFNQLQANLGGSFKDITPEVYEALLELMSASNDVHRSQDLLPLAEFGNKLFVKGVQEIVELHRNVCLDQLVLLILIEAEVNHGEDGIQFETADIFRQLIVMLQRLELVGWLSKTQISLPLSRERANSITEKSTISKKPATNTEMITVLEGVLRHLFGLDVRSGESMSSTLTEVLIQICAPESQYEASSAMIQCFLLKHSRADLAREFSRFTDQDAFSTYIQGRVCLASNDVITAALLFKRAAFGIANPDPGKRLDYRSSGYLDATEKNLLNAGMPQYYSHVVALFDKEKIYSFVIDFARLSLQFIKAGIHDPQINELRTEMHSRLFNAAMQTSRYDLAHSVLTLFTDPALQYSSLRTLVIRMCESSYASQLTELPFIGLQDAVDEILAKKCQAIIEVNVGVPYHKILYAWRIKHSDFRGAASVSFERLQRLQLSGEADRALGEDTFETAVTKQYIALINALSCVDPKQAWILAEEPTKKQASGVKISQPKRKVVTLDEIRKAYQTELDRIAAIQNDQFSFAEGDEMDVL